LYQVNQGLKMGN